MAPSAKKARNFFDGACADGSRKRLKRVAFENEIEALLPGCWRGEEISDKEFDRTATGKCGLCEALLRCANSGFGNIKRRDLKTPIGELPSVITKATAYDQCGPTHRRQRMSFPKSEEIRIGKAIIPRDHTLPCFGFLVKSFEPARGVAFFIE